VASACRAAAQLGVWMMDVHTLGGRAMMAAAREALEDGPRRAKLVGVTVLTSMAAEDMREVGLRGTPAQAVLRLAALARESGLDGVVCSAREAAVLRERCGPAFCLVTPGIRPSGEAADDQSRVTTPAEAIALGAHYLVIGRPVTRAPDPAAALVAINAEIDAALAAAGNAQ